ncbi:hypothetical protein HDE_06732 [Halotydeus destructor]|nr:hypothetical protein HDE_06732 [Halotydeus destructor]
MAVEKYFQPINWMLSFIGLGLDHECGWQRYVSTGMLMMTVGSCLVGLARNMRDIIEYPQFAYYDAQTACIDIVNLICMAVLKRNQGLFNETLLLGKEYLSQAQKHKLFLLSSAAITVIAVDFPLRFYAILQTNLVFTPEFSFYNNLFRTAVDVLRDNFCNITFTMIQAEYLKRYDELVNRDGLSQSSDYFLSRERDYRIKFTAYGLFDLNRQVLLTYSSSLITFTILFMQLNRLM